MDALTLLTADHNRVRGLFARFSSAKESDDTETMAELAEIIHHELDVHTTIEEEVFYPWARDLSDEIAEVVDEGVEEHHVVKVLLGEIDELQPGDDEWLAKLTVVIENVEHHAEEEETEMFPKIRSASDAGCARGARRRPRGEEGQLGAPTLADKQDMTMDEAARPGIRAGDPRPLVDGPRRAGRHRQPGVADTRTRAIAPTIGRRMPSRPTLLDELVVTVVVDNETDNLSSTAPGIPRLPEVASLLGRIAPTRTHQGHPAIPAFEHLCVACHGLSVAVTGRVGDEAHTVLFDVGPYGDVWLANAERLGLDLSTIEAVFLSHWHWDHSGGLPRRHRRHRRSPRPGGSARAGRGPASRPTRSARDGAAVRDGGPPGARAHARCARRRRRRGRAARRGPPARGRIPARQRRDPPRDRVRDRAGRPRHVRRRRRRARPTR